MLREVQIWAKVSQSPYIEHMYPFIRNESTQSKSVIDESPISGHILYIQMELYRMTLKDAIEQINNELNQRMGGPMTVIGAFIAMQFTDEIANGVNYLHSLRIMHRDLKPANIFVTDGRDGNFIKIGDFGSAKFYEDNDESDSEFNQKLMKIEHTLPGPGTHGYMAPEVLNSTDYNENCDEWSLGCIMMDLFCTDKSKYECTDRM
jgi:serine/threonine protein kinase